MGTVSLVNLTGNTRVDQILSGTVGIFEAVFPERIGGYYVEGSYANRTGLTTSDIDMTTVFKDCFTGEAERTRAARLSDYCASLSAIQLDIAVVDEAELAQGMSPTLKLGSLFIYGEDRRNAWPLLSIEEWARRRMHAAYWLIVNVFNRPSVVLYPIDYPDSTGEFYGYDQRTVRLPDGSEVNSTRNLIRVTGWTATALIAFQARRYVARKSDCHQVYQRYINDEWTEVLSDIYDRCRNEWGYLIPETAEERQLLRDICARTLAFENHFLRIYKDFVLSQLRGVADQARCDAVRFLRRTPYQDGEISQALRAIGEYDSADDAP